MNSRVPVFGGSIYKALVDAASDAIVVVDQRGLIVLINSQAETLFGYPRAEMLGQPVEMVMPEKHRAVHHGMRGAFLHSPKSRPMGPGLDLLARRKDGTEIPVDIALNPIESEAGILVCAAVRDVTRRKRNEDRLRVLLDSAQDAMAVIDQRGKMILLNSQVERVFGYRRKELLEQPLEMLLREDVREEHKGMRDRCTQEAETSPGAMRSQSRGRKKDGVEFPLEIRLTPHQTRDGVLVCASLRDETGIEGRGGWVSRNGGLDFHAGRSGEGKTILLVEEQLLLREWASEFLREHGYFVLSAPDPETALGFAAKHAESIDLLIADVLMPKMSGSGLAEKIKETQPRMQVLFATGHATDAGVPLRDFQTLSKPFSLKALANKVRSMLDAGPTEERQGPTPMLLTAPLSSK